MPRHLGVNVHNLLSNVPYGQPRNPLAALCARSSAAHLHNLFGHRVCVTRHKVAALRGADKLSSVAQVHRDDGQVRCHGLLDRDRRAFSKGSEEQHIGSIHVRRQACVGYAADLEDFKLGDVLTRTGHGSRSPPAGKANQSLNT
mgnify:CR=1 FL=1